MRAKREQRSAAGQKQTSAQAQPYLSFSVSGAGLILPLSEVSEILGYDAVAELPGAAEQVRGAVRNRGRVIPVVDVARNLRRPAITLSRRTSVLMLELAGPNGSFPVGILSEGLASLIEVAPAQIEAPPSLYGASPPYLRGVYASGGVNLALIDFAILLKDVPLEKNNDAPSNDDPIWAFMPPPL